MHLILHAARHGDLLELPAQPTRGGAGTEWLTAPPISSSRTPGRCAPTPATAAISRSSALSGCRKPKNTTNGALRRRAERAPHLDPGPGVTARSRPRR